MMIGNDIPYCISKYVRDFQTQSEEISNHRSFEDVVAYLRAVHGWFSDVMAEIRAKDDIPDEVPVGGLGVQLQNRWGGHVEVGVGRDIWFLFRHKPEPSYCFSDMPKLDGHLAFWLSGWHHTELDRSMLASREACLTVLKRWLESGKFPNPNQTNTIQPP